MNIAFTGDTAFTGYFKDKYSERVVDDNIYNFLSSSDYVVGNIETPITNCPTENKKIINIFSCPESANSLVSMHMNIWNLCNNHLDDCGIEGIKDTVSAAKKSQCVPLGVGDVELSKFPEPIIVGSDKCRVGLLSISDCYFDFPFVLTWNKVDVLCQIIRNLRQEVNYIVAVFHEGREFSTMPTPKERKRYTKLLNMGVDIVVAHHPHVVQNYEKIGDKIIFYSLGNFIFDIEYQRRFNYTDVGMLLKINFADSGFTWEYLPVKLDRSRGFIYSLDLDLTPPIFRDIQKKDYCLIFPLAAKYLRKNEKKISAYIREHQLSDSPKSFKDKIKRYSNCSFKDKIKKCYGKLRAFFNKYRIMLFMCSSVSGLYKMSKHRDLYQYIKNS